MPGPEVFLDAVSKRFAAGRSGAPAHPALDRVTLAVDRGELLVVVGPSGCGKSTALRVVAGLEEPDGGGVYLAGRSMAGVAPQSRDVAMVFQGFALYPHMTARQILEFPLRMRGTQGGERDAAVREAASMLRLEGLLDRRPAELSGGERQRVAMGRALVRKPRVFLFDEPLSSLDASLRENIRLEIGQLVRRLGTTAVYVTHDHVEAMTLADRIAVMRAGRIVQVGTPRQIYDRPATAFVGSFVGSPPMNLLPARADAGGPIAAGPFTVPRPAAALPGRVQVGVRPEDVRVGVDGPGVTARITAVEPLGAQTHLVLQAGDVALRAIVRGFEERRRGDEVKVAIDAARAHVFDADGDGARVG